MGILNKYHKLAVISAVILSFVARYGAVLVGLRVEININYFDAFIRWSDEILDNGSMVFMKEYHVLFSYIITGLRAVQRFIGMGDSYLVSNLLLKSPSIIAEVFLGILVYRWVEARGDKGSAVLIACLLLFNPSNILNSSVWGQVERLLTIVIALSLYYLDNNKRFPAALFYTAVCLINPQAIFFAPVVGMFYILPLFSRNKKLRYSITIC